MNWPLLERNVLVAVAWIKLVEPPGKRMPHRERLAREWRLRQAHDLPTAFPSRFWLASARIYVTIAP